MEDLDTIEWDEMDMLANSDTTAALGFFHDKVLAILERLVPVKRKPSKSSKSRIHRMRKTIWRRISKVKKKIFEVSSIQKLAVFIQNKRELEKQLTEDYSSENTQQEDQAIFNIKSNPKAFFSFAKSRQKTKSRIGPFLNPATGKLNPDVGFTAETLRQQYNSVFSVFRPDLSVSDVDDHFSCDGVEGSLDDAYFHLLILKQHVQS